MPIRQIPGTDLEYYLISYDENGDERREDGKLLSDLPRAAVADPAAGISDVFLISHGWKGDVGAAIDQYDRWMGAMAKHTRDAQAARAGRPGWKALLVGLHWPSLPFGDEKIPEEGGVLGAEDDTEPSIDDQIEQFAASIADTRAAREALRTILEASREDAVAGERLPDDVREAYETLYAESGLDVGDADSAPGTDHEVWDPDGIYEEALENDTSIRASGQPGLLSFGSKLRGLFVMPAQQLSFWKMKDRARRFGESGAHDLLVDLQRRARPGIRFHLMGHSFGCIVVSATVAGPPDKPALEQPVDTLFLVQGALSLWSYCNSIDEADGKPGYFHRIVAAGLVRGPIVTTHSTKDTAVGRLYPKAAGLARQVVLGGDFPKYGGIGTFGAQGLGSLASDIRMEGDDFNYGFQPGKVYNLESSDVIKEGGGFSGAHSDIAHPEVAHVMWQAVLSQ